MQVKRARRVMGSYYAPMEGQHPYDPTFTGSFRSMRRSFDFTNIKLRKYVREDVDSCGKHTYRADLKIVHSGNCPFRVKFDLMQVVYGYEESRGDGKNDWSPTQCPGDPLPPVTRLPDVPDTNPGPGNEDIMVGMGRPQGADLTYDLQVDVDDIDVFSDAIVSCSPASDLNNDGVTDASDVVQFFTSYVSQGG